MPKGTRVHRCVEHLKAKGTKGNPFAICQASTGQSFATGKRIRRKKKRRIVPKADRHGYY